LNFFNLPLYNYQQYNPENDVLFAQFVRRTLSNIASDSVTKEISKTRAKTFSDREVDVLKNLIKENHHNIKENQSGLISYGLHARCSQKRGTIYF